MPDRTITQLTVTENAVLAMLGRLGQSAVSGYDLKKFADNALGYLWAPSKTQLYVVLGRLVEAGLATRRDVPQRHRPDKHLYRITKPGRAVARAWLERDEDQPDPDRSTFMLKFFFGTQAARPAMLKQLRVFRESYDERLATYEEIASSLEALSARDDFTYLTLRFGIARARAAVAWADDALQEFSGRSAREARA